MVIFLNYVYIISLVFWVGGIFFFSAIAAPSIFKTLDKSIAGNLVTSIFPKYYFLGYVCGTLALFLHHWDVAHGFGAGARAGHGQSGHFGGHVGP